MPSVLYSTVCYIKNEHHHMYIYVDGAQSDSTEVQATSEFASPDIAIDNIDPSLTKIKLESVSKRKNTNIPKVIHLNNLLHVQHIKSIRKRKRNVYISTDALTTFEPVPITEPSAEGSHATLNKSTSEVVVVPSTPVLPRSYSLSRLFLGQKSTETEGHAEYKFAVKLSYIDVSNSIRWSIKRLEFEVESEDVANEVCVNLNLCLSTLKQRPRHLLAFVNPFGGKGRAPAVYEKKILPIFKEGNITVDTIHTQRANHARDHILNEDLSAYDGLICVGGDGMFAELCHGLLLKTSLEANLDIDDREVNIKRPNLRIGVIPAGSTDAVVYGTTGLNDPVTSAL
ncbi:unnamed protein product, partial [Adineta ricciae]